MKPHGEISRALHKRKKPDLKGQILYESMIFWQRQNYKDRKQISSGLELRVDYKGLA